MSRRFNQECNLILLMRDHLLPHLPIQIRRKINLPFLMRKLKQETKQVTIQLSLISRDLLKMTLNTKNERVLVEVETTTVTSRSSNQNRKERKKP